MENLQSVELFADENSKAEDALNQSNFSEAAKILTSIIEKDPSNWRAYNNLGIFSWVQKSWTDAYIMFHKACTLKADYEDALVNLFDCALKLKKVNELLPFFNKALSINPSMEDIKSIRNAIESLGNDIYTTKRALEIGVYSPIIEEAEKELEQGNIDEAMKKFLESNDAEGPNAAAFCGLGIVSFYQKRFDDAYTLFVESIKLNPSDPETFLNLLDAAKEVGKESSAREIFNQYRNEFPSLESIVQNFDL